LIPSALTVSLQRFASRKITPTDYQSVAAAIPLKLTSTCRLDSETLCLTVPQNMPKKSWTADEMHDEKRAGRSGRTRAKLTTESMQSPFSVVVCSHGPDNSRIRPPTIRDTRAERLSYHSGRQASASMPSASPGSGQGRSRAFQLRPASSDLKSPWLLAA
jgi:hypothetical protein